METANNVLSWWSIVICDIPEFVDTSVIRPQSLLKDKKGHPVFKKDGITHRYENLSLMQVKNIMNKPIDKWQISKDRQEELKTETNLYNFFTDLLIFMNRNHTIIAYHNGDTDPNCQYNSYHIHLMSGISTKGPLSHNYHFTKLKKTANINNITVRTMKLKHHLAFLNYLARPPRVPGGTNSKYLQENFNTDAERQHTNNQEYQSQQKKSSIIKDSIKELDTLMKTTH
jgi:hypothetical protein